MKKKSKKSAFFYLRAGTALALVLGAFVLAVFSLAALPGDAANAQASKQTSASALETRLVAQQPARFDGADVLKVRAQKSDSASAAPALDVAARESSSNHPHESRLTKAGRTFDGDLRALPYTPSIMKERPEREPPLTIPREYIPPGSSVQRNATTTAAPAIPPRSAPAPAPNITFDGLDFATWGGGHPPDTNGDVGPTYYIQTVNTSIGIYNKSNGVRVAAFTFNTFMSQGSFGNLCDTDNFGDPVVLYDTFEDRWVITDFAFQVDASGNVINPPGAFQCFGVSKTGDPVSGGWNFYSINTTGGLGDYPKFGIWPDGLYMTASMFGYAANAAFQNPRLYAFNKFQMYAGAPTVQVVSFDAPSSEFTVLPANARLQTGTPPSGSPNYYAVVWQFLNSVSIYKFHVDWNNISLSTLTGPSLSTDTFWWEQWSGTTATTTASGNDTLYPRLMMQNQYTNIAGVESVWDSHTVGGGATPNPTTSQTTAGNTAVRFYQVNVTGGTVGANTTQSFSYSPDTTIYRYMPSAAVDRAGNMAIGYTTSNLSNNPALKYAGRLSTDAANSITLTEQTLFQGTGAQSGACGTQNPCTRWGDYSAMSLDPDGCTFWYTNEYYAVNGLNDLTRIGSFKFSPCTVVGAGGTISGTVTVSPGGAAISGATVTLGSRTTTTNGTGNYSFTGLPAGTYPTETASASGYASNTTTTIVVTDGGTTTKNFALTAASQSSCLTDTTQADFQAGIPTNIDLTGSPGNVRLAAPTVLNQSNTNVTTSGFGFTSTSQVGQTFQPSVTGTLQKADVELFCSTCTGTTPNLTMEVRTTASSGGSLKPTATVLASGTIPGFSSGAGAYYSVTFASPPTLTAGTTYALIVYPVSNPSAGTYAYVVSSAATAYPNGNRVTGSGSGAGWTKQNDDLGFDTYMNAGFSTSGNFVSSLKDANPASGATPTWGTFSWTNAALPANTTLQFQAAASNNAAGVFNYVGPNGTSATFFTSGSSLSQFNGFRYLRYKALFTTTNTANTPTLNDVTVCFTDVAPAATVLAAASASGTYGGTVNLSATLTSSGNPVSGKTVSFTLNGSSVGSATSNASGIASLSNVSLSGINAGTYPTGVGASFAGDASYSSSNGTNSLTVNKANQTITFTLNPSYAKSTGSVALNGTASSGLTVTYGSSNTSVATVSGSTMTLVAPGSVTITADQAGDSNYNAASSVPRNTVITGPIAAADSLTRQPNTTKTKFAVSSLLANDTRIASDGSTQTNNLGVTGVTNGTGNSVQLSGNWVFYTPSNAAANAPLTFTYTLSDGTSTATGTVTVNTAGAPTPFSLTPVDKTTAVYDAGSNTTSITLEFITVANQNLNLEYSTDIAPWTAYAGNPVNTGPTGDFVVTITASGDHATEWNTNMYFRATRL